MIILYFWVELGPCESEWIGCRNQQRCPGLMELHLCFFHAVTDYFMFTIHALLSGSDGDGYKWGGGGIWVIANVNSEMIKMLCDHMKAVPEIPIQWCWRLHTDQAETKSDTLFHLSTSGHHWSFSVMCLWNQIGIYQIYYYLQPVQVTDGPQLNEGLEM